MTGVARLDRLLDRREENYRRRPDLAVRTFADAARFIDEVGFALLFPHRNVVLPSLWEAHIGGSEPLLEWDERASRVWHWRDELSEKGRLFYGKYLAAPAPRGSFVSLEMMPLFVAAAGGIQDEADLEAEYREGRLRREMLAAYRAIQGEGPTGIVALRRACGLGGQKLTREVEALERRFLVVRLGSRREGRRNWPSNVYDLLPRAYPSLANEAAEYDRREASRQVAERYADAAAFAGPNDLARALGWPIAQAEVALHDLVAAGRARPAARENRLPPGSVVSTRATGASSARPRAPTA